MVPSVREVLQTCCVNWSDKVSRPSPWGGELWWDDAFSKSRVRLGEQVKGMTVTLAVNRCSIACMCPLQLLGWEDTPWVG